MQILSFHKNIALWFTVLFAMYRTPARCSFSPFKYNHTGAISALYAIKATCTRLAQIMHNTFLSHIYKLTIRFLFVPICKYRFIKKAEVQ